MIARREVRLDIGGFHFGEADTRITTLLGSCVSIALWHPMRRQGGMCHYLLPCPGSDPGHSPGFHAAGAMRLFLHEVARSGARPQEYVAHMYGGGRMCAARNESAVAPASDIAARNVEAGRRVLREAGFTLYREDVGGLGSRRVVFDVGSGLVEVTHGPELPA